MAKPRRSLHFPCRIARGHEDRNRRHRHKPAVSYRLSGHPVGRIFRDEAVLDLCRNIGNQLPMDAVLYYRRAKSRVYGGGSMKLRTALMLPTSYFMLTAKFWLHGKYIPSPLSWSCDSVQFRNVMSLTAVSITNVMCCSVCVETHHFGHSFCYCQQIKVETYSVRLNSLYVQVCEICDIVFRMYWDVLHF